MTAILASCVGVIVDGRVATKNLRRVVSRARPAVSTQGSSLVPSTGVSTPA